MSLADYSTVLDVSAAAFDILLKAIAFCQNEKCPACYYTSRPKDVAPLPLAKGPSTRKMLERPKFL